jgi:hypothetical protein
MKKTIFAVLAAFVMSLGFMSCSSGGPEDKMISLMEDMVSVMKSTHIKSADDVNTLKGKLEGMKSEVEKVTNELMEAYKDKSPEELMKLAESMKGLEEKMDKVQKEGDKEMERLKGEAEALGLDLSEFGDLFD